MTYPPSDPRRERGRAVVLPNLSETELARLDHFKRAYALTATYFKTTDLPRMEAAKLLDRLEFERWRRAREEAGR